jgi:hypothetical protein
MRTVVLALAVTVAAGCRQETRVAADHELRIARLRAEYEVVAAQPAVLDTLADTFANAGKPEVDAKLELLRARVHDADRAIGELRRAPDDEWTARDTAAADALRKAEDARRDAWQAFAHARSRRSS